MGCTMPRRAARNVNRDEGLFPSEAEIARRLSQAPADWAAKVIILERDGLPRVDPLMGGRYWPAVQAYWNRRYGISKVEASQPDGEENLDALR
jgi:hypothetical protein